jgi:hypothetical protein
MLTTFTHLAYAFCAAVLSHGTGDLVVVGYVSLDRCFVQIETSESVTKVLDGHDISIDIVDDGAVVEIDTVRFAISKTPPV